MPEQHEMLNGREGMTGLKEETEIYREQFNRIHERPSGRRHPWLHGIRKAAISRFYELGFPTTREEAWRYTSVAPIARTPFKTRVAEHNGLTAADLSDFTFAETGCCQLVFVDGKYSA